MNLNRRVPNGLPGGVRGRKFYYFLLLDCCHQIYLLELYHELFKSKCPRLSKNNLNKLIKILDPHYLNYNFENFYSLL